MPPRREPKARIAIQTEADRIDRTIAIEQISELQSIKRALIGINATLQQIVKVLTPTPRIQPKASAVFSQPEIEKEEIPMPVQLYPTQRFKDTFRFNGPVDAEPVIIAQGPFLRITQDPKTEVATEDPNDPPNWVETFVVIHGECTQPDNPNVATDQGGMISLYVEATVDVAGTDEVEKVRGEFVNEFQWILPGQPKASTVGSAPEIES